jgi:hypothetical protein
MFTLCEVSMNMNMNINMNMDLSTPTDTGADTVTNTETDTDTDTDIDTNTDIDTSTDIDVDTGRILYCLYTMLLLPNSSRFKCQRCHKMELFLSSIPFLKRKNFFVL